MEKDLNLKDGRILDGRFNEGLFEESWFHGEISCDEAETILSLEHPHESSSFLLKCEICSKYETKFPSSLKHHKKICKSPIKCSTCDKSFRSEKSLRSHAIRVHKKRELARAPCDLCGSILSSASKVAMHKQAIHNIIESKNENRYQCPKCDFKTTYKTLWGKHKHKYQCDDCPFFTNKKTQFEKHNALFHKYLIPIKEKKRENIVIIGF